MESNIVSGLEVISINSSIYHKEESYSCISDPITLNESELSEVLFSMAATSISTCRRKLSLKIKDHDLGEFIKVVILAIIHKFDKIELTMSVENHSDLVDEYVAMDKFYPQSILDAVEKYLNPECILKGVEIEKCKTLHNITRKELSKITDSVWNYRTKDTLFPSWNNVLFYKKQYDSNDLPVVMRRLY